MTTRALHSISVLYQTRTDRGVCIRETEDGPDIWLPRAETVIEGTTRSLFGADAPPARGAVVTLTAPEWLLIDKGLV